MSRLLIVAAVALVSGIVLLVADLSLPTCRNFAATARDSGYPCNIDRSSGATDFVFSRSSTISVPFSGVIAVGLIVAGGIGMARSRRR